MGISMYSFAPSTNSVILAEDAEETRAFAFSDNLPHLVLRPVACPYVIIIPFFVLIWEKYAGFRIKTTLKLKNEDPTADLNFTVVGLLHI